MKKDQEFFPPTDLDLPTFLEERILILRIYIFLFGGIPYVKVPRFPNFQIATFPDFWTPAAADKLSDLNLTLLPHELTSAIPPEVLDEDGIPVSSTAQIQYPTRSSRTVGGIYQPA